MSRLLGLSPLVPKSYLAFQVLDLFLFGIDVFVQHLKLLRDLPLTLPGGGCLRQLLAQAGHFVLQAGYDGIFVLRVKFKI